MRVLVCGSRDWTDHQVIYNWLLSLVGLEHVTVIDGKAKGADALACVAAAQLGHDSLRFPADWKKYGKAAGPIRNQQMLDEGKPDLVLAFWKNKSKGTADMIRRARKAGVEVRVIEG